jgi:hypothetical protein
LHVDFTTDSRFDNPRAVQVRLNAFSLDSLVEVGNRVRDVFAAGSRAPDRIRSMADTDLLRTLAGGLTGKLGGKVGVAPRIFLKKLVGDVLDRIDEFPDFDPRKDYALTLAAHELNDTEQAAAGVSSVDDIRLDL